MQLELFSETHEHVFEEFQGPVLVNPVIQTNYKGDKWCWTCASWIDLPLEEMAAFFAIQIKAGKETKRECLDRMSFWNRPIPFGEIVTQLNIAIGNLNEGIV